MTRDQVDRILEQWARERPDVDISAIALVGRLRRVARHFELGSEAVHATFGLAGGAFNVLAALRRSGPPYRLSPTELFRALMLSSGAMTNRIDRLEQAGLVARGPDPDDRRGVLVSLTPKGRELIDAAIVAHAENGRRLLGSLTRTEQQVLAGLLRKLLLSFEGPAREP